MSHSLRQSSPTILLFARIIRTGTLDLPVNDVGQSISKIGSIVIGVGGFVEKSTQTNSGGSFGDDDRPRSTGAPRPGHV
jgi:hypothetical protein